MQDDEHTVPAGHCEVAVQALAGPQIPPLFVTRQTDSNPGELALHEHPLSHAALGHLSPQLPLSRQSSSDAHPALQTLFWHFLHGLPQSASAQQPASGMHVPPQRFVPSRQRQAPLEQTPPPQSALPQQLPFGIHVPLQRRNPEKQAQVLPWHTPLPPQLPSVQHEPAGKHCLPHFTFGALHFFFFFFAAASPWPSSGSAPAAASSAATPRRVCEAETARARRSNCEPSTLPPPESHRSEPQGRQRRRIPHW